MTDLLAEIRAEFHRLADPRGAADAQFFFKDQNVAMHGLTAPQIQRVARDVYPRIKKMSIADRDRLCTALWGIGKYEGGALVCYVYRRFAKQCGAREFALFTRWLDRYVDNWAHTDGLSLWLLGAPPLIEDEDEDDMVQKGVGWLLKETYPKKAAEVVRFLVANRTKTTRMVLRYAAEKMTAADKARVLAR
jgi:3-methyladenine DNA glycosylase AlkD